MIHSGAVVAAGISQGRSSSLKFDLNVSIFSFPRFFLYVYWYIDIFFMYSGMMVLTSGGTRSLMVTIIGNRHSDLLALIPLKKV